jgi:hypothetical protein
MDELLQTIAGQKGYPADLVQRSAQARANAAGVPVEEILRSWAGEEAPAPSAAPAPAASEAVAPAPPAPEPAEEPAATTPKVEVLEPAASEAGAEPEAVAPEPEPEPAPARTGLPRWLAVAFVVVPSIALLYALVSPAGPDCGSSGALAVDPETGVAVNCDGSDYGADASDLFSIGQAVYEANCTACHGAGGGGGVGPAFTNGAVLATFSSCADHIEWVAIGSNGWPDPTYGDNDTPVLGSGVAMPGFSSLTNDELVAVSLYERVAFGGEDRAAAEESCAAGAEEVLAAP